VNGDNCWHPTDDNLGGIDSYGTYDASTPMSTSTYTIPFAPFAWTEVLLASGDMSMYVVMDRSSVEECSQSDHGGATTNHNDGQWFPHITTSSESDEYDVTQYCRSGHLIADCAAGGCRDGRTTGAGRDGNAEDPWVSVGHHGDGKIVYGEGMCGQHWDHDAAAQGGMNVWVNSIDLLALIATTAEVTSATMSADSGDPNRDTGTMIDLRRINLH
jgi:hypothetical protein